MNSEEVFVPAHVQEREPNNMDMLCDYLLYWTVSKYNEAEGEISTEVYDRAVSYYGIAVPSCMMFMCVAAFVCVLGAFWRGCRK